MLEKSHTHDIISSLHSSILPERTGLKKNRAFPVIVKVDVSKSSPSVSSLKDYLATTCQLSWQLHESSIEVSPFTRAACSRLVSYLRSQNCGFSMDYSCFKSHPATFTVHNLLKSKTRRDSLERFFHDQRETLDLLDDVVVISLNEDLAASTVSAEVVFKNHLDVDKLLESMKILPNPFFDSDHPLVFRQVSVLGQEGAKQKAVIEEITKEFSAHEIGEGSESKPPKSSMNNPTRSPDGLEIEKPLPFSEDEFTYDTIVIENISYFAESKINMETFHHILSKFSLFHRIDALCFPVVDHADSAINFKRIGYIGFSRDKGLNDHLLQCLYHLNGLTLDELCQFSKSDIYDVSLDIGGPEPRRSAAGAETPKIKLSICQKKHNHHLFDNIASLYIGLGPGPSFQPELVNPNPEFFERSIIARFLKSSNYQETNVYVNNLPLLFRNDDEVWQKFWDQFAQNGIKSAKIIKPQYYSKKSDAALGKFGFVFYEDFHMALRAIILTNNRWVRLPDSPCVLIQTSFAIQKRSSSHSGGKPPTVNYPLTTPVVNYGGVFSDGAQHSPNNPMLIPPPESFYSNPLYLPMPAFPGLPPAEISPDISNSRPGPGRRYSDVSYAYPVMLNGAFGHPGAYYYYPYLEHAQGSSNERS